MAKVLRRSVDEEGNLVGTFSDTPALNTLLYDVEFPDGAVKQYAANIIAQNILYQVDANGRHSHVLEGVIGHRKTGRAVEQDEAYITTRRGQRKLRQTTVGWELQVQWRDKTTQWVPLKVLKEDNPVEVAVYAKSQGIDKEPAFSWWVPYTLKKRERIIASVRSRVVKRTHKYGIEVPTSMAHARRIDETSGTTLWKDAVDLEVYNNSIAFHILEDHEETPVGWTKTSGHWVFDVRMDFSRKAR